MALPPEDTGANAMSTTGTSHTGPSRACQRNDLLFLTIVVLISVVPYISGLGFYTDDWASLGAMTNASDQSVAGLVKEQFSWDLDARARPTNTVYQAILVRVFGLNPLGYHVVNALVFLSAALLLYLTFGELGMQRTVALSTAAVYILLPNYSTDRFWFIAFGYGLSMALFLASTYAFLRAARSRWLVPWTAFALLALAAAALAMEVVVPLMLAIPAMLWWQSRPLCPDGVRSPWGTPRTFRLSLLALAVIATVAAYKSQTARGFSVPDLLHLRRLVAGSVAVNFGTYGVVLPVTVAWGLRQLPLWNAALGVLLGILVFSHLARAEAPPESSRFWTALVLVGCIVFALGTAIFLTNARVLFWSAGIANRVWIAAALGCALVLVGVSGWVSVRFSGSVRRRTFSLLITSLCVSGFVVNSAFATFWIDAWQRQLEVVANIRQTLPALAPGTTLILDGVCPYIGPAIVFESSWDLAGALRVAYRDRSLRADVIAGNVRIGEDGVWTQLYGTSYFYPYGNNLLLFEHSGKTVRRLTNARLARTYISEHRSCPEGAEGRGALMLPVDLLYGNAFRGWR
jgi:hypothetical protein